MLGGTWFSPTLSGIVDVLPLEVRVRLVRIGGRLRYDFAGLARLGAVGGDGNAGLDWYLGSDRTKRLH